MYTYSNRLQLSKTYYNVLFGSSTQDRHARHMKCLHLPTYASCMTILGERTEQLDIIAGFLSRH